MPPLVCRPTGLFQTCAQPNLRPTEIDIEMLRLRTVKHLTRLPTLLRTPLCRRCTSGAPSEYLQEPSEKQLAYAEALAEQVHAVSGW